MSPEQIRETMKGAGPLVIVTSDGLKYRVPNPKRVMVARVHMVIEQPSGRLDILDPVQVVSIRPRRSRRKNRSP